MGRRDAFEPVAREHGWVMAVVGSALVGVLAYSALTSDPLLASPGAPLNPFDQRVGGAPVVPGPSSDGSSVPGPSAAAPTSSSGAGAGSGPGSTLPGERTPAPDSAIPPPTTSPAPSGPGLPAPGVPPDALGPLQELIDLACVTAFTPFGLPGTVLGLAGGALPITLPDVPFQILIQPISEVCIALQGLANQ